jgi:hypothetical protein
MRDRADQQEIQAVTTEILATDKLVVEDRQVETRIRNLVDKKQVDKFVSLHYSWRKN